MSSKLTAFFLALSLLLSATLSGGTRKPNIVFFFIDDLGWSDLGCYGSTYHLTPNIDSLAGRGMRFTDGYAACPVCSPTRAALMTGKFPARLGITDWIGAGRRSNILSTPPNVAALPQAELTFAEVLSKAPVAIVTPHLDAIAKHLDKEKDAGVQGIYGPGSNVVECAADMLRLLGHNMPPPDDEVDEAAE